MSKQLVSAAALLFLLSLAVSQAAVRPSAVIAPQAVTPQAATYVGSAACRTCHAPIYERWTKTRMANVVRDPSAASRRDHSRSLEARSAADVHEGRHCVRLRQQVEAALFHESRRRLLPAAGAMGHHQQGLAAVLRAAEHRLVGAALSRRQHAAPDRAALRRLPFRELQRADQGRHRVERRLRKVPRPGQRARRDSRRAANIVNPARLDFVQAQRHLHSVPLAGQAPAPIRSTASTTTGRSASTAAD